MASVIIMNVKTAQHLNTCLLDECDIALDYITGVDNKCFTFFDEALWDAYSTFLVDIADLFNYNGVKSTVVDYIEEWADDLKELYIAAGSQNKKELAKAFSETFWNELSKLVALISANLYAISKKQAG